MMRNDSLSHPQVISLITNHFVPLWLSRDTYQLKPRSMAEKTELRRIDRNRQKQGLKAGSVCVYIISPKGDVVAVQRVHEAAKPEKLIPFLKQQIKDLKLIARKPDPTKSKPVVRAAPPAISGPVLHIYTRFDERRKSWGVSEDWLVLTEKEWESLTPGPDDSRGKTWKVPQAITTKLFLCFYPPGPNWKKGASEVIHGSLKVTVLESGNKLCRARLTGDMEMTHPFAAKAPGRVTGKLIGYVTYDVEKKEITELSMVASEAVFSWKWKGKDLPEKMSIGIERQTID